MAVGTATAPAAGTEQLARRQYLRKTLKYLAWRVAIFLITLWGAWSVAFLFFRLMPGDPVSAFIANLAAQGEHVDATAAAEQSRLINETLGRNGNLVEQYLRYFGRLLQGDFGASFLKFPEPAIDLVLRALPWTAVLLAVAVVISWLIGLALGAVVAWQRDRAWVQWLTSLAIAVELIPYYFIALLLLVLFAYGVGTGLTLFPVRGAYQAGLTPGFNLAFLASAAQHAILPALSIVLANAFRWMIATRALMINVLGEDYLLYAQAKGLPPGMILFRYALRNALLPQITALAISLGFVINGAILLEQLFLYPGVGLLLISAIREVDVNTAQAIVLLTIAAVLTANLLVDLILPFVDPRVQNRI